MYNLIKMLFAIKHNVSLNCQLKCLLTIVKNRDNFFCQPHICLIFLCTLICAYILAYLVNVSPIHFSPLRIAMSSH